jgi:hypothetical protein
MELKESMSDVVRRRGLSAHRPAWSGELGDLQRLVSLVEQLANQRIDLLRDGFASDLDRRNWLRGTIKPVLVEITEKTDSVTGPPPEIYSELDRRTVRQIRIFSEFNNDDEALEVILKKDAKSGELLKNDAKSGELHGGVVVAVKSTNAGWAEQSLAELTNEIDKAVPKWAVLRKSLGFYSSLVGILLLIWGITVLFQAKHIHRDLGGDILISFVIVFLPGLVVAAIGGTLIWPWMFPAFELYGEGGTSSGGRRLAALGAFVLSIVGGIIVYLVT